jgi:hypothetical protein
MLSLGELHTMPTTQPTSMPSFDARAIEQSIQSVLVVPTEWPSLQSLLAWCQSMGYLTAIILFVAGVVYLLYGQQYFKVLVALNVMIIGAWIGAFAGAKGNAILPGALLGIFLSIFVVIPAMKHCVMVLAACVGFITGCIAWNTFGLLPSYAPAGGLVGMVFLFMLSFISLRPTVILSTGIQGAGMLILGALGFLYKYGEVAPRLDTTLTSYHYVLPLAVLIPAMVGFLYQYSIPPTPPVKK